MFNTLKDQETMEPYIIESKKMFYRTFNEFKNLDFLAVHGHNLDGGIIGRVIAGPSIIDGGLGSIGFEAVGGNVELGCGDESIYVWPYFREMGIGTELLKCTHEYVMLVSVHEQVSFRKFNGMVSKNQTFWRKHLERDGFIFDKDFKNLAFYSKPVNTTC